MRDKAKKQADKLRNRGRDRGFDEQSQEDDRYNGPRRRDTDRQGGGDYHEERYERRGTWRAKSAGRDSYGGRGLRDDQRQSEPLTMLGMNEE